MHGIVKNVDVTRGIVLIESCGMQAGTVPYVPADPATAALYTPGQTVVYQEGKRAIGVELDNSLTAVGILVESDGKTVKDF